MEALACGMPVVSFDTGALPELVTQDAGRVVAYGADAWRLEPPDIAAWRSPQARCSPTCRATEPGREPEPKPASGSSDGRRLPVGPGMAGVSQ